MVQGYVLSIDLPDLQAAVKSQGREGGDLLSHGLSQEACSEFHIGNGHGGIALVKENSGGFVEVLPRDFEQLRCRLGELCLAKHQAHAVAAQSCPTA